VTDASPKGLIPQLTELLHALTDSQELLVHKLRTLQGQHRNDSDKVIEWALRTDAFHSESHGLVELRPPVLLGAQTDDGSAQRRATEDPEIGRANGSTGLRYARGRHAVTDERALVELEEAIRTETDTPKAAQSQGDVIVPRGDTNRAPAHVLRSSESIVDVHTESPDASADRNYNFFDELDAKLTDVRSLDTVSRDEGSS
jgi:hypothetical protein